MENTPTDTQQHAAVTQTITPTPTGFYGPFGGAYVPEILYKCVHDLQDAYLPIIRSEEFQREYASLLRDYVGRPSPLYYARRMSEKYGCKLYLKREDLNHTGAHKINNTIGRSCWRRRWARRASSPKRVPDSMAWLPPQCAR